MPTPPPPPPVRPVTDTYFGTAVADRYRYFENMNDPVVQAYFKDQNAYTRAVLARLDPARERLFRANNATRCDRHQRFHSVQLVGSRYFYLRRAPGDSNEKLCVRDTSGGQERVLVDPDMLATKPGQHFTINYFSRPSTGVTSPSESRRAARKQRPPRHRDRDRAATPRRDRPRQVRRRRPVGVPTATRSTTCACPSSPRDSRRTRPSSVPSTTSTSWGATPTRTSRSSASASTPDRAGPQ